ncbi:ABC transporter permease [Halioxenophilus sp. WMMB6]|uniref:ABC transporter permease n=1 Tax=Halioxenophilus sp. WMMB6 TaxID=3073815 RepID=UPI00295F05F8|nr:ABC transporter permease [Halioxenophilus sp. WMMB6]
MSFLVEYFWRVLFLFRKELLALVKDPKNRLVLVGPALIQSMLFGYGATYDLNYAPYALLDQSRGEAARELMAHIDGTGVFVRRAELGNSNQIAGLIDAGEVLLVLTIPADFDERLAQGQAAPLQLILDGRNSSTAAAAAAHIGAIVGTFNRALSSAAGAPVTVERRAWFNPNLESRWQLMPAMIAALSMLQTLLIAALSVAREREQGTFDQLLVTPLTPLQILIGKALPAIFVGLVQSTIVFLIIQFWFQVPIAGSVWLLYLGLVAFTTAAVGVGLSLSAVSLNMQQAMLYTFLLIMPLMLLSGLLTPIRNMPEALQIATYLNPLRFGIELVRRVYLEGAGFSQVAVLFVPMLVLSAITLPLSAWLFRHRLA